MTERLQSCFGTYDTTDIECNGELSNKELSERSPCIWRKKCGAFTRYLEQSEKSVSDYLKVRGEHGKPISGYNAFNLFCKQLVKNDDDKFYILKRLKNTFIILSRKEKILYQIYG